jgi:quercetin dioxygenase-like cupin family protein
MKNQQVIQTDKWDKDTLPTEAELSQRLRNAGIAPTRWENVAGTVYHARINDYHKVIYVVSGSIVYGFRIIGEPTVLTAGDRLSLPAGIEYNAVVGDAGVVCLEGRFIEKKTTT